MHVQVVFHLHNSFQNPLREMTLPPYEVTEQGWGEFEIIVEVWLSFIQWLRGVSSGRQEPNYHC